MDLEVVATRHLDVQVYYDKVTRIVTLPAEHVKFNMLVRMIQHLFDTNEPITMKYRDVREEKTEITFDTEIELMDLVSRTWQLGNNLIKIVVEKDFSDEQDQVMPSKTALNPRWEHAKSFDFPPL